MFVWQIITCHELRLELWSRNLYPITLLLSVALTSFKVSRTSFPFQFFRGYYLDIGTRRPVLIWTLPTSGGSIPILDSTNSQQKKWELRISRRMSIIWFWFLSWEMVIMSSVVWSTASISFYFTHLTRGCGKIYFCKRCGHISESAAALTLQSISTAYEKQ